MYLRFKILIALILTSVLLLGAQILFALMSYNLVNDKYFQDNKSFNAGINLNFLQIRMNMNQLVSDIRNKQQIGSFEALQNVFQSNELIGRENDGIQYIFQENDAIIKADTPTIFWFSQNYTTLADLNTSQPDEYRQLINMKPLYLLTRSLLTLPEIFTIQIGSGLMIQFGQNIKNYTNICADQNCINQYSNSSFTPVLSNTSIKIILRSQIASSHKQVLYDDKKQSLLSLEFIPNFPIISQNTTNQVISQGIIYNNSFYSIMNTSTSRMAILDTQTPIYIYFSILQNQSNQSIAYNLHQQSCKLNESSQFTYQQNGSSLQKLVSYSQWGHCTGPLQIFYIQMNSQFNLNNNKFDQNFRLIFATSLVVSFVFLLYVWRKSVVIGLSVELPVKRLVEIMSVGFRNLEEEEFTIHSYEEYFASLEMQKLFMAMIHFVNNIKYSNNKLWDIEVSEAQTLIKQSKSKQFYQHYGNLAAVGICASNISRIHMKNKRYLEAMNEQEESILIGNQEIQGIREYQDFVLALANKSDGGNIIQIIQKFKNKLTQRFKRMDDQWIKKFFNREILGKKTTRTVSKAKTNSVFIRQLQVENIEPQKSSPPPRRGLRLLTHQPQMSSLIKNLTNNYEQVPGDSINDVNKHQIDLSQQVSEHHFTTPQHQSILLNQFLPSENNPLSPQEQTPIQSRQKTPSHRQVSEAVSDDLETQEIMLKLSEVKQEKRMVKLKVVYRKYQLASILFNYSLKQQKLFLNESINLFKEIFDNSKKLKNYQNVSLFNMQINILTKQAFCHSRAGQIEEAQKVIDQAKEIFEKLKNFPVNLEDSEDLPFIDIFKTVPLEIQYEKIKSGQGILDLVKGDFYEAATKFVEIIDTTTFNDPAQQKFALNSLRNLFGHFSLPTNHLDEFQQKQSQKKLEIIILIDYTAEMTSEQLVLSHSMSKFILDEVAVTDEIGLYAFNEILYEAFSIQKKGPYRGLLDQTIKQLLQYPGGGCNLFKILQVTAAYLFDTRLSTLQRKLKNHIGLGNLKINLLDDIERQESRLQGQTFLYPNNPDSPDSRTQLKKTSWITNQEESNVLLLKKGKPKGDDVESCIANIFNPQDEQFRIDADSIDQEERDQSTARYILLFAEGVKTYSIEESTKLKKILQKKNINLVVFNIANQNANMLYLKLLSGVTEDSRFLTSDSEITKFIQDFKEKPQMKKLYLEFF